MNQLYKDSSIGVFDSGVGGLTVLRQLLRALPEERFIYFGDTARLPYGDKSPETVLRYALENANFLLDKNIKLLVVACSTASAHALDKLRESIPIPIIGVIEPGVDQALRLSREKSIAVLGTKGTIQSQAYKKAILKANPEAFVVQQACPLFVPLVEEGYVDHPATRLIVQEYLRPLKEHQIDTILLGCTHYPFLKELIRCELADDVVVVDTSFACAEKVIEILEGWELKASRGFAEIIQRETVTFIVSDDPVKFQSLGQSFLGLPIDSVKLADTFFQQAARIAEMCR